MRYLKRAMITMNKRMIALTMVLVLGISVFGKMPGSVYEVNATSADDGNTAGTEAASTEAASTEAASTNVAATSSETKTDIDPNGTLGKNSDVGVEVTESITGVAGKDVTVSFKLTSGNANVIKIRSVYPVIDTMFPFETSGDAYKVISSGEDANQQAALDATYTLRARSDLENGYQSVRFIGEYSKIAEDGTSKDYYVIRTINIYFSATETVATTEEKTTTESKKSSSKKKTETTTESSFSYDDDSDDGGSYSTGGFSGGGSSGDDGESEAPKLIINGFDTDPKKVMAGDSFKMTIHVTNSSKTTNVCNGKFLIGDEAGNFLPTSGSNAVFVEKIGAGETGDIEIELKTSADLAQKNYRLMLKGDFDDGKGTNFSASESVYLPVYQEIKMNITDASMTPESIGIGSQGSLVFTINNQSSAGVYNVSVSSDDEAISTQESYVGNIAANASAYATLEVKGEKDNSDKGTIQVKITYEDSDGEKGEMVLPVACLVGVDAYNDDIFGDDYDEDEDYEEGIPWWIWLIIGVAVVVVIIVIIILVKKKKKKLAKLMEEEDDDTDFFGENKTEGVEDSSAPSGEDEPGDAEDKTDITDENKQDLNGEDKTGSNDENKPIELEDKTDFFSGYKPVEPEAGEKTYDDIFSGNSEIDKNYLDNAEFEYGDSGDAK